MTEKTRVSRPTLLRGCVLTVCVALMSGCVGTPVYNVLQPDAALPLSNPGVRNTGTTPSATAPTQSSAAQINDAEKKRLQTELVRAGVQNNTAKTTANSKSEAEYLREVRALREEAKSRVAKRLKEIESRAN